MDGMFSLGSAKLVSSPNSNPTSPSVGRRSWVRKSSTDMKMIFQDNFLEVMGEISASECDPAMLDSEGEGGGLGDRLKNVVLGNDSDGQRHNSWKNDRSISSYGNKNPSSAPSSKCPSPGGSPLPAPPRKLIIPGPNKTTQGAITGLPPAPPISPVATSISPAARRASTRRGSWISEISTSVNRQTSHLPPTQATTSNIQSLLYSNAYQLKLLSFSNAIMMETTLGGCYSHLMDSIIDAISPDTVSVFELDEFLQFMVEHKHTAEALKHDKLRRVSVRTGLANDTLTSKSQYVLIDNVVSSKYHASPEERADLPRYFDEDSGEFVHYLNVLYTGVYDHTGRPLAVVETCFKEKEIFERYDVNFVRAISLLAASAIRSAKLYEDMARSRKHSDALLEISQAVSGEENGEEMIKNILNVAVDAVDADLVILHHYDPNSKQFSNSVDSNGDSKEEVIHLGEDVEGFVAQNGEFVQLDDFESFLKDPRLSDKIIEENDSENDDDEDTFDFKNHANLQKNRTYIQKSVMCAPVIDPEGNILAVLKAVNKNNNSVHADNEDQIKWSEEDSSLLQSIAESAGVALHKAELLSDILNEQKMNKSLISVMKTMNKHKDDVDEQIKELVEITYDIISVERVTLFLVDDVREELICAVSKDKDFEGTRLPIGNGIAGHVASQGETLVIEDAENDSKWCKKVEETSHFRTKNTLCMPIRDHRHKIVAVIQLLNKSSKFTDNDKDILDAFSQEIASALKKALLEKAFQRGSTKNGSEENETMLGLFAQYSKEKTYKKKQRAKRSSVVIGQRGNLSNSPVNTNAASERRKTSSPDVPTFSDTPRRTASLRPGDEAMISPVHNKRVLSISNVSVDPDCTLDSFSSSDRSKLISAMNSWEFDVLKYDSKSLMAVAREFLLSYNIPSEFEMGDDRLEKFLFAVRKNYRKNSFHNFYHASAVMHISFMMLSKVGAEEFLETRDVMCCLVGALVHDVDHTGYNNDFEKNSLSQLALTYNDRSILENHHAATTFKILQDPDVNIFHALDPADFRYVRKSIIEIILKTDMVNHFEMVKQMQMLTEKDPSTTGYDFDVDSDEDRLELMTIVVHSADLSNPTYPKFDMTRQWCHRVCEEFSRQAVKEKSLGLPVSPFMEGLNTEQDIAKLQIGFVNYVILPLWKVVGVLFPNAAQQEINCIENVREWEKIVEGVYDG